MCGGTHPCGEVPINLTLCSLPSEEVPSERVTPHHLHLTPEQNTLNYCSIWSLPEWGSKIWTFEVPYQTQWSGHFCSAWHCCCTLQYLRDNFFFFSSKIFSNRIKVTFFLQWHAWLWKTAHCRGGGGVENSPQTRGAANTPYRGSLHYPLLRPDHVLSLHCTQVSDVITQLSDGHRCPAPKPGMLTATPKALARIYGTLIA